MRVYGHSMAPSLNPGELVFIREGAYESRPPHRGEIVAARPALLGGRAFIKRVVGLPHERITRGEREWQLGDDQFFLLGDQTEHSMDSRIFGPVDRKELIGPVRMRVWPFKLFRGK
jgi:signal peptidase I